MGNWARASYRESPAEPEGILYRFFGKDVNFYSKHGNINGICGIQENLFVNFVQVEGFYVFLTELTYLIFTLLMITNIIRCYVRHLCTVSLNINIVNEVSSLIKPYYLLRIERFKCQYVSKLGN
jgi:hypothetical protein